MKVYLVVVVMLFLGGYSVEAAEISAMTGLFKSERNETKGENAGGKDEISLGVRYADVWIDDYQWFTNVYLTSLSYSEPKTGKAPSDAVNIQLGGGLRWFFPNFSQSAYPFVSGALMYLNMREADLVSNVETKTSGLYYGANVGFRFELGYDLFFDLSAPVFISALVGEEKKEEINDTGNDGKSISSTRKTELFIETSNTTKFIVSVGTRI